MSRLSPSVVSAGVLVISLQHAGLALASDALADKVKALESQVHRLEAQLNAQQEASSGVDWGDLLGVAGGALAGWGVSWLERRREANRRRFVRVEFDPYREALEEQLNSINMDSVNWASHMREMLDSHLFRPVETWTNEDYNADDEGWIRLYDTAVLPVLGVPIPPSGRTETREIRQEGELLNAHIRRANQHLANFAGLLRGLSLLDARSTGVRVRFPVSDYHALRVHAPFTGEIRAQHAAYLQAVKRISESSTQIRQALGNLQAVLHEA